MKKTLAILMSLLLVFAVFAGCSNGESSSDQPSSNTSSGSSSGGAATGDPIKIGSISPLTGDTAFLGTQMKNVCEFLAAEVNADGGVNGRPIEFVHEDDQGTTAGAATAVRKLIDVDKVNAIMGPLFTSSILGMKDAAIEAQIPVMIATSANGEIFGEGHEGNYLFTLDCTPALVADNETDYWIKAKGFTKIAMFGLQNDQTTTKNALYNEMVPEKGGEVVFEMTYNAGTDDFRSSLTALKASGAEVVMLNVDRADLVKIVRQMSELDMNNIWISADYQSIQDDVWSEIGDLVDGRFSYALTGLPADEEAQAKYDAFVEDYKAATNVEQIEAFEAIFYDCGTILINAMRESGAVTGPELRDYLANNVKGFSGVTGKTTLIDDGLSSRSSIINEYKDQKTVQVQSKGGE